VATEGTYLVRFNNPSPTAKKASIEEAPFILTRVDPWTKEIRHTYIQSEGTSLLARVYIDPKRELKMQEVRADTVQDILIQLAQIKLDRDSAVVPLIDKICPGHPFQELIYPTQKRRMDMPIGDPRLLTRTDSTDSL